jgi:hypothetical protein
LDEPERALFQESFFEVADHPDRERDDYQEPGRRRDAAANGVFMIDPARASFQAAAWALDPILPAAAREASGAHGPEIDSFAP